MANNQKKNNDTQSQPRPERRSGFSATEFIKKQLERNKTADTSPPASEVVLFPITTEPLAGTARETERKPGHDVVAVMNQYLTAAEEHLSSGAVWEAVGVYRAILKIEPDNLQVRQLLIEVLLKNNAKPDAIKELGALAEIYQKQDNEDALKQTYQKIIELDPENQAAISALGLSKEEKEEKEEEVIPETIPAVSQSEPLPVQEPLPIAASVPESPVADSTATPEITEPVADPSPTTIENNTTTSPVVSVSLDQGSDNATSSIAEPPSETENQQIFSEPTEPVSAPEVIVDPAAPELEPDPVPESTNGKLEYYRKKLEINPRNITARLGYINAYLEIGLEFELVPEYLALAEAYLETNDLDAAEKTYRHILTLEPDQALAMQGLVAISKLRNEPTESPAPTPETAPLVAPEKTAEDKLVDNYRRILQLNPLNSEIAHRLVAIFKNRNQLDLAITELQLLGDAYMQRTMYSQAMNVYNEALEIDQKNPDVIQKLEKAKELQQSMTAIDSAIKSYKSGLDYGPVKRSK
jgi:tetratricopeptide (TPR) repeat protein